MHTRRCLSGVLLAVACTVLPACGYSTSSLLRKDISSVCVPVFDNQTFYRGLETRLTKAVVEEVELHTRLRFAARARADSVLEGELLEYDESVVAKTTMDAILVKKISAKARFRWVDRLTGAPIVRWTEVRESARFAVAIGEPQEERVFRELAQRIVEKMEEPW